MPLIRAQATRIAATRIAACHSKTRRWRYGGLQQQPQLRACEEIV